MSHRKSKGAISFSAYLRHSKSPGSKPSCRRFSLGPGLSPLRTSRWSLTGPASWSRPLQGTLHTTASPSFLGCQGEGSSPLLTVQPRLPFTFRPQRWARHVTPCRAGSPPSPLPPHCAHVTLQGSHPSVPENVRVPVCLLPPA